MMQKCMAMNDANSSHFLVFLVDVELIVFFFIYFII